MGWLLSVSILALVLACGGTATASKPVVIPVAYAMVINTVQRAYPPTGALAKPAAPGQEYLALDVTLMNTGTAPLTYNPLDFRVKDRAGYEYGPELAVEVAPRFRTGTLASGEIVSGGLAFAVPAGAEGLTLLYATGGGSGPRITATIAP